MIYVRPGNKGTDLEEILKAYFWHAGYFVVRGIPFRLEGDDVTDVDLWLYERPAALTRRRLIVDVKNRRSPKVSERLIWTKGLQSALGVDGAIVATTDKRRSAERLAKELGITLLDGDAVAKLTKSEQLRNQNQLTSEEFNAAIKSVDDGRHSNEWREHVQDARSSLISGIGVSSTNQNLTGCAYFAEQSILSQPRSTQAKMAVRLFYLTSAFVAISLDYTLADQAFQSQEDRRRSITDSIRFGQSEGVGTLSTIQAAIGLARKYVANGAAAAKQIEYGFNEDAARIPAEIIAQYVARIATSETLFNVAREVERASMSVQLPSYDELSADLKSLLGVVLDFNAVSREKFALAWPKRSKGTAEATATSSPPADAGPLFGHETSSDPSKT